MILGLAVLCQSKTSALGDRGFKKLVTDPGTDDTLEKRIASNLLVDIIAFVHSDINNRQDNFDTLWSLTIFCYQLL